MKLKKLTSFDEHLDKQYGKKGNPKREKFEKKSLAFRYLELLNDEYKSQLTNNDSKSHK